jgi:hypothetical protein
MTASGERTPGDLELVEVLTVKPQDLLLSVLDEAAAAVSALERAASRLGRELRAVQRGTGRKSRAGALCSRRRELDEYVLSLGSLASLTNSIATMVSGSPTDEGGGASALISDLSRHRAAVITAQGAEDPIALADIVEEVRGTLRRWPELLTSLRRSLSACFPSA